MQAPNFRFYALYDKVNRKDVLAFAYECCKANGGAARVDDQTLQTSRRTGVERWLDELAEELKSRTYQPLPVRGVYIPKSDGKQRPPNLSRHPRPIAALLATTAPALTPNPMIRREHSLWWFVHGTDLRHNHR